MVVLRIVLSKSAFPYFRYGNNFQKPSKLIKKDINTPYTSKQPLMMVYEGSRSTQENFGKFISQFLHETKILIKKT